jgi:hypothetical protein
VYCSTDTLIPPSPSWLISTSNNNLNDALSFHGCFKTPVLPRRRVGLDVSKSVVTPNESLQSNSRVISLFFCFVGIRWALLQSPFVNGLPVQLGGHQDVHAGGIFLALLAEEKPVFYRRHKRRRETEVDHLHPAHRKIIPGSSHSSSPIPTTYFYHQGCPVETGVT